MARKNELGKQLLPDKLLLKAYMILALLIIIRIEIVMIKTWIDTTLSRTGYFQYLQPSIIGRLLFFDYMRRSMDLIGQQLNVIKLMEYFR